MSLLLLLNGQADQTTPTPTIGDLDLLYKPVRDDVARRLRARLYAQGGRIPTFLNENDENGPTDPTADEVDLLIDDAATDIASEVGVTIPAALHPIARRVVALGAAMLIEVGSQDFDEERYDRLKAEYDEKLKRLLDNAQDLATGGETGNEDDRMLAMGSFPPAGHSWDHVEGAEIPCDPRRWCPPC